MKYLKSQIQKNALLVCVIFCLASCASCKKFNWKPDPYAGDSANSQMVRSNGEAIKCDQPAFDEIIGFDCADIAALKSEIDRINNSKVKNRILFLIDKSIKCDQ